MTTTTKKSVFAILMLVFVFVCCFGAFSAVAGDVDEYIGVEGFEKFVTENLDGIVAEDMFKKEADVKAVHEAIDLYKALSEDQRGNIKAEVAFIYNVLQREAAEPFAIEAYINLLEDKLIGYKGARVYLSDEATVLEYEGRYNALANADAKAWIASLPAFPKIEEVKARIAVIKAAYAAAQDAIDAIEYLKDGALVADAANDGRFIVLASEATIDAAGDALFAIYNEDIFADDLLKADLKFAQDKGYLNNLADYDKAVADLAAQKAIAAKVDAQIADVYAKVGADVYYTLKGEINAAKVAYDALAGEATYDATYNDLQSLVSNVSKLDEMLAKIVDIQADIDAVEVVIDAIGVVKFSTESDTKIKAALNAFEALPADVVAADKAAVEAEPMLATIVENYKDLLAAEKEYAALAAKFAALLAAIDDMAAADSTTILAEYIEARTLYLTSSVEIQERLKTEAFVNEYDPDVTLENYAAAYDFYAARAVELEGKVNGIIRAINNLDDVKLTVGYVANLLDIEKQYNALNDEEKQAVTNSQILKDKLAELAVLLQGADTWVEAVNNIGDVEATKESFDLVKAAKDAFAALGADAQATIESLNGYSAEDVWYKYEVAYDVYAAKIAESDALMAAIVALNNRMLAIDVNGSGAAWIAEIDAITEDYLALDTLSQKYLEGMEGFANYLAAKRNIQKSEVIGIIDALPAVADITVSDAHTKAVEDARAAVEAYLEVPNTAESDITNLSKLEALEEAIANKKAALDKFEADVEALVGSYDNIAKIVADKNAIAVDLDKANALKVVAGTFSAEDMVYITADGIDDVAKLDEIIANAEIQAQKVEDDMVIIINKGDNLVASDYDTILGILGAYDALSDSQEELVDANIVAQFKEQVDKFVFVNAFKDVIDDLMESYKNGADFTSDTPVIIGLVRSMYTNFTDEQRDLIGDYYDKIDEIETAYKAALAAGKVVNVTNLKGVVDTLKAALEATDTKVAGLEAALAAAEDQIKLLDEQLELAEQNNAAAKAEAQKAVETLQSTITTIIIIFSILVAGLAAAVVVLFIKRK